MTPDTLEYLLRLTVIWAVLLAYYFAALRRTGFAVQRFYLLGTLAFGLVVPLLPALGGGLPVAGLPSVTYAAEPYFHAGEAATEATGSNWSWSAALSWFYLGGVAFFAARTLVQWRVLWQWITSGTRSEYFGYRLVRHPGIPAPFVAFGWIFLPERMPDAGLENTALVHEAAHLRARHHYDTLLLTLGSLLLWFHPLFWVFRRQLTTVHEYEADAAVIQTIPARTYGLQLLQASLGPAGYPGLFSSPLKERIDMITNNDRARKLRLLPLLTLCLLLLGLVVACSDVGEDVATPLNQENPFTSMAKDPFAAMDDTNIRIRGEVEAVDVLPHLKNFAGDVTRNEAVVNHLVKTTYERIRYPKEARATGTEGTIAVLIGISDNGEVTTIDVRKKVADELTGDIEMVVVGYGEKGGFSGNPDEIYLTDEVGRIAKELVEIGFYPATKDGKPVASMLPLNFKFILEK